MEQRKYFRHKSYQNMQKMLPSMWISRNEQQLVSGMLKVHKQGHAGMLKWDAHLLRELCDLIKSQNQFWDKISDLTITRH